MLARYGFSRFYLMYAFTGGCLALTADLEAELAIYPGGAHGFRLFANNPSMSATARMDAFPNRALG